MQDTFKHKGLRQQMVKELEDKGIHDEVVLQAMLQVPRHFFLDSIFEYHAYEHKAFPIGSEQTISSPYTVAFQSALLALKPVEKVLEIGTGSGYQTAILIAMGAEVYTIERQQKLFIKAQQTLRKINYTPRYMTFGDGYKGLPTFAPFDKIIITAGAPYVPKNLLDQLKIGGVMVIPLGEKDQIMTLFLKTSATSFEKHEYGDFRFVPMLKNKD